MRKSTTNTGTICITMPCKCNGSDGSLCAYEGDGKPAFDISFGEGWNVFVKMFLLKNSSILKSLIILCLQ